MSERSHSTFLVGAVVAVVLALIVGLAIRPADVDGQYRSLLLLTIRCCSG